MAWLLLICAGLLEIVWVLALKQSAGFSKFWPSVVCAIGAGGSFYLLSLAFKYLPMGTAYAVWTGIGAVGVAIIGMLWLSEAVTLTRIVCIGLIVAGIVGLKLSAS